MKIFTVASVSNTFTKVTNSIKAAGGTFLGGGLFATTYQHPTRDDLVIKVAKIDSQIRHYESFTMDGYVHYLRCAAKYPSVFHPRVLSFDAFQSERDSGRAVIVVTLEKLRHAETQSDKDCFTLTGAPSSFDLHHGARLLTKSDNIDRRNLALSLVETWKGHGKDLHGNNWMIRDTAQGPIPVITDPAT